MWERLLWENLKGKSENPLCRRFVGNFERLQQQEAGRFRSMNLAKKDGKLTSPQK